MLSDDISVFVNYIFFRVKIYIVKMFCEIINDVHWVSEDNHFFFSSRFWNSSSYVFNGRTAIAEAIIGLLLVFFISSS